MGIQIPYDDDWIREGISSTKTSSCAFGVRSSSQMHETSLEDIRQRAFGFHEQGNAWHFHMLTPECIFNTTPKYAFVLEDSIRNQAFVNYSESAEKELGEELVLLLLGSSILNKGANPDTYEPSGTVKEIIQKIEKLSEQEIEWHHHMLFPECRFNKHKPKWAIVFEDQREGQTLESLSDVEPVDDMRQLEILFYGQEKSEQV